MQLPENKRLGFTLVELLVVIGIIALLISILLPSLNKARQAANTVACLANQRSIGQALAIYVSEFKGALPGSGVTSGRHFWAAGTLVNASAKTYPPPSANIPEGPIAPADYIGPLARMMQLKVPTDLGPVKRYQFYRESKVFTCPSAASMITTAYTGGGAPDAAAGPMLGYATNFNFLITPAGGPGVTDYTRINANTTNWWTLPAGYFPKITKVGRTSDKIFLADAAKFFSSTTGFTYNLDPYPAPNNPNQASSSIYTDYGAFTKSTRAYDRTVANGGTGLDGRTLSYRHGKQGRGLAFGSYRLNALFFDGHAETLSEAQAINPASWLPTGTVMTTGNYVWDDATAKHNLTYPFSVP
jgi:prepilin-type N-terminal cleavage/methylation domain-containing protein/prepilin-type processing-associated H-X9-DG protein